MLDMAYTLMKNFIKEKILLPNCRDWGVCLIDTLL